MAQAFDLAGGWRRDGTMVESVELWRRLNEIERTQTTNLERLAVIEAWVRYHNERHEDAVALQRRDVPGAIWWIISIGTGIGLFVVLILLAMRLI